MDHAAAITFDPHAEEDRTSTGIPHDKMGMWVFLCSEVMFFTGLIGSYIVLRYGSTWPDPKETLNIWQCHSDLASVRDADALTQLP